MIPPQPPPPPPRRPQLGFLVVPPYRIQGLSIAGEETVLQIPEMDLCFDIGRCPRSVLSSKFVALTHGHMDHAASFAYYFSQRQFQGMGVGTLVCPQALVQPVHNVMRGWIDLEAQRTPYEVLGMGPDDEIEIKNNLVLRAFATLHTVPSIGYVVLERRSKLRPEFVGLPQEKLVELKQQGQSITQTIDVPQICYTGDTMWGPFFDRPDVRQAKILITECTFIEPGHRSRAAVGKHLHLDDIVELVKISQAETIVLTHLSRRTHIGQAQKWLDEAIPSEHRHRVVLLMDHRANKARYDQQTAEASAPPPPEE